MAVIKLYIPVGNLEDVLNRYDRIEVHRSVTTRTGAYTEITTVATRIELVRGNSLYIYFDETGERTYWYRSRYLNSGTGANSGFSDAILGDEAEDLSHIMTVDDLKAIYLTGIDLTDDAGNPYPDIMFDFAIRAAIGWLETELSDIEIRPTTHIEKHDYDYRQFQNWGHIQLEHYPVISVTSYKLDWPSLSAPYEFPSEWIRFRAEEGRVNLVPTSGTIAQALALQPYMVTHSLAIVPDAIEVTYQSGFAVGAVPTDMRAMIGMRASYPILNTAGDLIAGAGIASTSIGIDGLSQSINTTSSATNSGYGARLVQYSREIKEQMRKLKLKYMNIGLAVA